MMCAAQAGQRGRRVLLIEHYHDARREDPHLRRRPLQLHQRPRRPRELPLAEPGLLPLGARALHAARLHRAGRAPRHRVAREEAGPALLRRHAPRHHRHAEGRVRRAAASQWRMPCAVRRRRARRRRASPSRRGGAACARVARHRDRRPHGAEDRRDALRLPDRRAVRPGGRAAAAGAGAARVRARRARALRRPVRACRSTRRSRATAARFRENLLFTHRGLSGPAILQISSYWDGRDAARRSTCCPGRTRAAWLAARRAARRAAAERCSPSACRSASRRRGARRTASRCRCAELARRGAARRRARALARLAACCRRARSATTRRK